jgi:type IV pilus assembly protein PilQ
LSFTIDNPARISLDLADTQIALPSRRVNVKQGVVDTVNVAEANGRTRVVLNLNTLVAYQTRTEGNALIVTVGGEAQPQPTVVAASAAPVDATTANLSKVDFRRGVDGAGRVVVQMTDSSVTPSVKKEGQRVIVTLPKTAVSDALLRRLDVVDFATPVNTIDTVRAGDSVRIEINAKGQWDSVAYQSDSLYTVELKPMTKAEITSSAKEYKGERLTLNFQSIETRAVLQLLAETSGQNMVISDTVQGNVTLRLQNVPWDQALDIVMQTKGLDSRKEGNVILVAPAAEIASREKQLAEAKQDLVKVESLHTEYLQVNYAKATDLANLIKGKGNSLMSERGNVTVDERTNTLLLQDTTENITNIRKLVSTLDIPVRQVLIEARVVIVNDDFSRELGARLGVTGARQQGSDQVLAVTGTAEGTDTIIGSALTKLNSTGTPFPVSIPSGSTASNRYMVNLPTSKTAGSFALGFLASDYLLDLELSAAQSEGRGEIVSSPKLITANQKEASIEQGVEIPYQQSASSGAATISFKKATLSLKVTPQITPDDQIILSMAVTKDSVGQVIVTSGGVNVPSIDTRQITTQVLVNNGHTVVLGGILETEMRDSELKVPLLGDIPLIGHLFKSNSKTRNKAELLIFVTPKILHEGAQLN